MKTYVSLFRIRLINNIQYRAITFGIFLSNLAWLFMELRAYAAIYESADMNLPMAFSQIVSYVWVKKIVMSLLVVVAMDFEIYSVINDGSIAYELVRPIDLYWKWFCQAASNRVSATLVSAIPVLILVFVFPKEYRMSLPTSIGQFAMFILSVVLALGVVVAFAMLMFISLFYTIAQRGIKIIVTALVSFLSGGVIPLVFFPAKLVLVLKFLPFSAMQSTPLLIYSGNLNGREALNSILLQVVWLGVLIALGKLFMFLSLKKVVVQGG